MELEKINIEGVNNIYAISLVKKEFTKAANETWKDNPPWERYQRKLIQDISVLDQEMERAVDLPQYEKLNGEVDLYSIRHPETKKNIRIIYAFRDNVAILLTAFLEKNNGDYKKAIKVAKKRLDWIDS